jgi:hypothetical protein
LSAQTFRSALRTTLALLRTALILLSLLATHVTTLISLILILRILVSLIVHNCYILMSKNSVKSRVNYKKIMPDFGMAVFIGVNNAFIFH